MFAGEIVCGGAWTVGVIILRREDTDTFRVCRHLYDQLGSISFFFFNINVCILLVWFSVFPTFFDLKMSLMSGIREARKQENLEAGKWTEGQAMVALPKLDNI